MLIVKQSDNSKYVYYAVHTEDNSISRIFYDEQEALEYVDYYNKRGVKDEAEETDRG